MKSIFPWGEKIPINHIFHTSYGPSLQYVYLSLLQLPQGDSIGLWGERQQEENDNLGTSLTVGAWAGLQRGWGFRERFSQYLRVASLPLPSPPRKMSMNRESQST